MSRKGEVLDNAAMEARNSTFKFECDERFETNEIADAQTFDYIEVFYNRQRRHSAGEGRLILSGKSGTREDTPRRRDRLPHHPERLRGLLHHGAIDELSAASQRGRLREPLVEYLHPHVLVVD